MPSRPSSLPFVPVVLALLRALGQHRQLPPEEVNQAAQWITLAVLQGLAQPASLLLPPHQVEPAERRRAPTAPSPPSKDPAGNEDQRVVEPVQVARADTVRELARRVEVLEEELHRLRDTVTDSRPRLLTKKAFLREHPDLYTKSGLDKVLFLREDNGLSDFGAIYQRKKGCRVLIDPKRFLAWYRWFHGRGARGRACDGPRP